MKTPHIDRLLLKLLKSTHNVPALKMMQVNTSQLLKKKQRWSNWTSGGSSTSDDDRDAAWKAAIDSIAAVGFGVSSSNGAAKAATGGSGEANHVGEVEQPQEGKPQTPGLKLYQIKVRNMLDDMLEKNLEIIKAPCLNLTDPTETEGGIKLFKKAPPGIKMDSMDKLHVQLKRPRIVPGQEVDEKSKKFRHMLQSVVVDGSDILVSAKKASQRLDWKREKLQQRQKP